MPCPDPIGEPAVLGGEAPGRVRQHDVAVQVEEVGEPPALGVDEPVPADGHRHHLAAGGVQRLLHQLVRGVLAGPDEQAVGQLEGADAENVFGHKGGH
jgi:hypothetical protein